MAEDSYSFTATRSRLEEIVAQVRKKDTSLEKSLDLLEEGVRLANQCTELIDHVDWDTAAGVVAGNDDADAESVPEAESVDAEAGDIAASDGPAADVDGESSRDDDGVVAE